MNQRNASLMAGLLLCGCTTGFQGTDNGVPYFNAGEVARSSGASDPANSQPVPVSDGWQPGETLFRNALSRFGTTPEGYDYSFSEGGKASLSGGGNKWTIDCSKDAISDRRNCSLHAGLGSGVFLHFNTAGEPQTFCVFGHDFPGRTGAIRVNSGAPVFTDQEGCVPASRVVPKMLAGTSITTRRVEWPNDWNVDHTLSLAGFSRAAELAKFLTLNIDRVAFRT